MTDRHNAILVVLDHDMRDDDSQRLIDAIKQLRGVCNVVPNVADPMSRIAETRARQSLLAAIGELLRAGQ